MDNEDELKQKLWNIEILVEEIRKFPQTYKTILGQYNNGTNQLILRRKINILCHEGKIYKGVIPGTRFGEVVLYTMPKTYSIVIVAGRMRNNVLCFFEHEKLTKFHIKTGECWLLDGKKWLEIKEEVIFSGNILKWI